MKVFTSLASNVVDALDEVRQLAAGKLQRARAPRRLTTYQLTRDGQPLRKIAEVRNRLALPPGWRFGS